MIELDLCIGEYRSLSITIGDPYFDPDMNSWASDIVWSDSSFQKMSSYGATPLQSIENAVVIIRTMVTSEAAGKSVLSAGKPFLVEIDGRMY